jgi:hypothetical protein
MDYTELLKNQSLVSTAMLVLPTVLLLNLLLCCSCFNKAEDKTYEDKEVAAVNVEERNSRLAFMLMLLLNEDKKGNRKYIRMADSIGYDHIIDPVDLYQSDSDSGGDKTE